MANVADLPRCELYACKNPQHDDPSAVLTIQLPNEEEPVVVKSCLYHASIVLEVPLLYSVGRTYRGEIEVRPIGAQFAPPSESEE